MTGVTVFSWLLAGRIHRLALGPTQPPIQWLLRFFGGANGPRA